MRKSTIFLSAALTTFALAMLYGVVSAYRGIVAANPTQAAVQPTDLPATEAPATDPATLEPLSPVAAAQEAAQVLGRSDLLSAESSNINGVDAYKISFVSGDVVYVGLTGQILSIQTVPQVITVQAQTVKAKPKNKSKSSGGEGGGEHDD